MTSTFGELSTHLATALASSSTLPRAPSTYNLVGSSKHPTTSFLSPQQVTSKIIEANKDTINLTPGPLTTINPPPPRLAPQGFLHAPPPPPSPPLPLPLAMVASAPTFGFGPNHHSCSQPLHSSVALTPKCCFHGFRRPPAAPYAAGPDGSPRSRCPSTRSPSQGTVSV